MIHITEEEAKQKDCTYLGEKQKCTGRECMSWCFSDGWNIVKWAEKGFCSRVANDLKRG